MSDKRKAKMKEGLAPMYCRVPRHYLKQFKAVCAARGCSMQEAVSELMSEYLLKQSKAAK